MARKSVGYREMMWTCPNCGAKNMGSSRFCKSCGSVMSEDIAFEQQTNAAVIEDAEVIERAKRGPDVYCAYCGNRNPAGSSTCNRCGAELSEGTERRRGQEYLVDNSEEEKGAEPIICQNCGAENPAGSLRCGSCGGSLQGVSKKAVERTIPAETEPNQNVGGNMRRRGKGCNPGCAILLLLFLGFAIVAGILFSSGDVGEGSFFDAASDSGGSVYDFGSSSSYDSEGFGSSSYSSGSSRRQSGYVDVEVYQMNWQTRADVMGYLDAEYSNWEDSVPANAENVSCYSKLRHTYDEEVPGSREVCGETYSVDMGNGYEELYQDCVYQVYEDYCSYTVSKWGRVGIKTNEGTGKNPESPAVDPQYELQNQTVNLKIVFADEEGYTYSYSPSSLSEYRRYDVGEEYRLKVNSFGTVLEVEKK